MPCTRCAVGLYKISECNATTDQQCQLCPLETYCFNDTMFPCSPDCNPDTETLLVQCTPKTDRVCCSTVLCDMGQYQSTRCTNTSRKVCSDCPSYAYCPGDDVAYNCSLCDPGFYSSEDCTPVSDRQCNECPLGYLCNDGINVNECSVCASGKYRTKECTTSVDTECANCSLCPLGFYAGDECNPYSDAVCYDCPVDFLCNDGANVKECSVCGAGTYKFQACTTSVDTVCRNCTSKPSNSFFVGPGTTALNCQWACNVGYSKSAVLCMPCTNKPANSTYTSSGPTTATCEWECNAGFVRSDLSCLVPTTAAPPTTSDAITTEYSNALTTVEMPTTTAAEPNTTEAAPDTTEAAPPPPEPVPLQVDIVISEPPVVVCLNLEYFVQSFCDDVRADNSALQIHCTGKSLNGVECLNGTCPCDAFSATRRRLLQANANLSTVVVYDVAESPNSSEPVQLFRPVIKPAQPWILAITVTELPRAAAAAADSSVILIIAGAVAGILIIGAVVGLSLWLLTPRARYDPLPPQRVARRMIFIDLKNK
jgi:hypothetical protein